MVRAALWTVMSDKVMLKYNRIGRKPTGNPETKLRCPGDYCVVGSLARLRVKSRSQPAIGRSLRRRSPENEITREVDNRRRRSPGKEIPREWDQPKRRSPEKEITREGDYPRRSSHKNEITREGDHPRKRSHEKEITREGDHLRKRSPKKEITREGDQPRRRPQWPYHNYRILVKRWLAMTCLIQCKCSSSKSLLTDETVIRLWYKYIEIWTYAAYNRLFNQFIND